MKAGYWWCTASNKTSHCCLLTSGAGRDVLAPLWPQPSITPWAVTHGKILLKPLFCSNQYLTMSPKDV